MIRVTKATTTNNTANNNLSVLIRQEVYDTCHLQPFLNETQIFLYNENYE